MTLVSWSQLGSSYEQADLEAPDRRRLAVTVGVEVVETTGLLEALLVDELLPRADQDLDGCGSGPVDAEERQRGGQGSTVAGRGLIARARERIPFLIRNEAPANGYTWYGRSREWMLRVGLTPDFGVNVPRLGEALVHIWPRCE
jgi:hypothetical protein